jgi:hypothetical protein
MMAVALYFDVHVPRAIRDQLRLRQVDVLTAQEDGRGSEEDDVLLQRSTELGRLLFTQDTRFKALAHEWQRQARTFAGLAFGHQQGGMIGDYVLDLELIAKASEPAEWINRVEHLPYPRLRP